LFIRLHCRVATDDVLKTLTTGDNLQFDVDGVTAKHIADVVMVIVTCSTNTSLCYRQGMENVLPTPSIQLYVQTELFCFAVLSVERHRMYSLDTTDVSVFRDVGYTTDKTFTLTLTFAP